MRGSFHWVSHALLWSVCLLLTLLFYGIITQSESIESDETGYYLRIFIGVIIIPAALTFYSFYYYLFPRFLQKKKITESIIYGLLLAISAALIAVLYLYISSDFALQCYRDSNFVGFYIMILVGIISGSVALILKGFITWFKEIQLKEELMKKNHQMEMALVKSQLDPHFLFNTINNIDVLILKDATLASEYLNQLSDIMRFILYETKTPTITLNTEILYIEKYIALQKIRTSNTSYANFNVEGDPANVMIAPMSLIPFVENAFKHTRNKKFENAIQVEIIIQKGSIQFACKNKYDPTAERHSDELNGLGNELIAKRLQLIYGDKHQLITLKKDNHYLVELRIQYDAD